MSMNFSGPRVEHRRLIRLIYQNKERIVEPHDYGIQNGSAKLLA